jgi:hypothetical protein
MSKIFEYILEIIKAILLAILWSWILYGLGYLALYIFTLGKYPKNLSSRHKERNISLAGIAFIVLVWFGIAGYNNFIGPT